MGTRFNRIKEIYGQEALKDILLLAGDEDTLLGFEKEIGEDPEDFEEFEEEFEEEPEAPKPKPEKKEAPQPFSGLPEGELETEQPTEKPKPIVMPGSEIQIPQLSFSFGGRKFEPGAALGKECPRCNFVNRPIYLTSCKNCVKIFKQISRKMELYQGDETYTAAKAIHDLRGVLGGKNYRPTEPMALAIFNDNGVTNLGNDTIREIPSSSRKILEDLMWYKLNVAKDPKTGEPEYDENGIPLILRDERGNEKRVYFSTEELCKPLHLSSERFRALIDRYNSKVLANLPPDIAKNVKRDESGEPMPASKRLLARHGWAGPAVVIGTGMADVRRKMNRKDPWRELSEEEEAAMLAPAFKSIDVAAWKWEDIKPAFLGWIEYLKKIFLPELKKYKVKARRKAIEKVIMRRKKMIELLHREIKILYFKPGREGMRTLKFLKDNPGETRETLEKTWGEHLKKYLEKNKEISELPAKLKADMDPEVLTFMENWDKANPQEKRRLTSILNKSPAADVIKSEIKKLRSAEKAAKNIQIPQEVNVLSYLQKHPKENVKSLNAKYGKELNAFMTRFNKAAATKAAYEKEIETLQEARNDLLIQIQKTLAEPSFDIGAELRKFEIEDAGADLPKNPEVAEEEVKLLKETEDQKPTPADPETVKTSSLRIRELNQKVQARSFALHKLLKLGNEEDQLTLWPEEPKEKTPEPEGLAGVHEFRAGQFKVEPFEKYNYVVEFRDQKGARQSIKGTGELLEESFEEDLQNRLGKFGYHNFGAIGVKPNIETDPENGTTSRTYPSGDPKATLFKVVVTDLRNHFKSFYFDIQEGGPIANWYGTLQPTPNVPKITAPEVSKEVDAPDDTFGNQKGVYEVSFNWRADYEWSQNAWYGKFRHSPERARMGFEDLIKRKIEMRFNKILLKAMKSENPDYPDLTSKKYVKITVLEPGTEEEKVYSMLFNRLSGEFEWKSTSVEERKEKQRRLKLPENSKLNSLYLQRTESNYDLLTLDDLVLVGKNGLQNISEPPKENVRGIKHKPIKPRIPARSEEGKGLVVSKQKEKFNTLSPEDQEYEKGIYMDGGPSPFALFFERELGLEQDENAKEPRMLGDQPLPEPMEKEVKELSGKCPHCNAAMMGGEIYCTNPDCKHPTEKGKKHLIVEEHITWKEEKEKKDSKGKTIYNPITQEPELEEVRRRVPSYSLVTISFDSNGKPKTATCQKVSAQPSSKTDTKGPRNRLRFKDIWNEVKEEYAPKIRGAKKEEREALIQERKKAYETRSQKAFPKASPYTFGRLPKVGPPKSRMEVKQKAKTDPKAAGRAKCREWPLFREQALPKDLDKIECTSVQAAVKYVLKQPLPQGARVWAYEEVTDVKQQDPTKRYNAPEFAANDKMASRFDRIYKLSKMK